ncbi:MAG: PAS domain-containing protein [Alkalispirochaeta sp.]
MERSHGERTNLYHALFRAHVYPMIAADRSGRVVAWNDAAGEWTGLPRDRVLGRPLWEVHASVAPAAIPYEDACRAAREAFFRFVHHSEQDDGPWHVHVNGDMLSATGTVRHIHSEIFPVWVGDELVIVGTLADAEGCHSLESSEFSLATEPTEPTEVSRDATAS